MCPAKSKTSTKRKLNVVSRFAHFLKEERYEQEKCSDRSHLKLCDDP
jgi:hypothetical protein